MKLSKIITLGCSCALGVVLAKADSAPFSLSSMVTDSSGVAPITVSGTNFINFMNNLFIDAGPFQTYNGHPVSATTTFLGVPNAINYVNNAGGTSSTIGLPTIGFSMTFTGPDRSSVKQQIDDFFQKNGAGIYAQFLASIAQASPIAVTDGNPNSATAIAADTVFMNNAFTPSDELAAEMGAGNLTAGDQSAQAAATSAGLQTSDQVNAQNTSQAAGKPQFGGFAIGFDTGQFKAGAFKGNNYELSAKVLDWGITDRVRLVVPVYASYLTVDGAKVGGAGFDVALPVRLVVMDQNNPFNWRITPVAGLSARASADLASGAALWEAGIVSTVDYKINPKLVICIMDQFTFHESIPITYGSYSFNPQVNQQITKNGVRLVSPLTRRVIGDFFVVETDFLKPAVTKSFTTFGGSLSFRVTQKMNVSLAANYDTGTSFQSWSVGLASAWHW